ncbi:hypothetical protein C8R41DRAFT_386907 [Lentinula lateritia]|uniref:Uncharacterized protein n=1 Tax=Lentinula lateritia TaxID=40482 RepID=A0ABQ8VE37_9AGAR|nr:hypothetical protein C8R41DRAFT_386907 [Lentinula lateritia]
MSKTPMPRSPPRRVSVANTTHSNSDDLRKMALIGAHFHGNQRYRNHPAIETRSINNPQPLSSSSKSIPQHPSANRDLQYITDDSASWNYPVAGTYGQASQFQRNAGEQPSFFHPQGYGGSSSTSDDSENRINWGGMNQQLVEQMSVSSNNAWTNSQAVAAALASQQNSYLNSSPQADSPRSQPHSHPQQLGYHEPDASGTPASQSPSTSSFPRVYGWIPRSEEDLKPIARLSSRYQPARAVTPLVPSMPQQHSPTNTRQASMTTRPTVPVTARSIAIPIHYTERHSGSIPIGSSQTLQTEGAGSSIGVPAPSPLSSSLSSPVSATASTPSTSTSPARHSRVPDKRWAQGQSTQKAHPSQGAAQSPPRIRNANLNASSQPPNQSSLKDRDSPSLSVGKAGSPQSRVQQNPVSFPRTSNTAPPSDTPSTPARLSPIPPSPHLFRFFAPGQKQYQQFQHQPIFSGSSHPPQSSNLGPSQPSLHLQPLLLQPAIELRKIAGRKRKAKREVQGEDLGSDWSNHDSPAPSLYQSPGDSAASPIFIRSRSSSPVLPSENSVEYPLTYSSPSVSSSITIAASSSSVSPASSCSTAVAVASSASSASSTPSPSKLPLKIVPHSTFPPNLPLTSEFASIVNSKTIDPHLLHCTGPPKRKKPKLNSHEPAPPAPTVQEMILEMQKGWEEKEKHEREAREKEQKELNELQETREKLIEALKGNEIKRNLVESLKQFSNGAVDPRAQAAHIKLILAVLLAKPSTSLSPPPNTPSAPWVPMMTESVLEFDIERDITRSSTFGRCSVTRRCQVPPSLLSNINHSKNSVCLCTRSSFPFSSTRVSKPISSSASSPASLYPIWKPVWVGGRKI